MCNPGSCVLVGLGLVEAHRQRDHHGHVDSRRHGEVVRLLLGRRRPRRGEMREGRGKGTDLLVEDDVLCVEERP